MFHERAPPPAAAASEPSPSEPAPSSLLAAADALQGTWLADYKASTNRAGLLSALGLGGLQRITAEKLIEGAEVVVVPGSPAPSSPPPAVEVRYLTVVPFFRVTERVPLDGSPATQARRDLKAGKQTARAVAGGPDGRSLVITLTWPSPSPARLVETYTLVGPDEMHVTSLIWTGVIAAVSGTRPATGPPKASATTVYRRAPGGRWTPRYRYPGGGGGSGGGAPDPGRRAVVVASLGLAARAAVAVAAQPAAAFPALPGMAPRRPSRFAPAPMPLFPRRSLDRPFAVVLMRACYDALADAVPGYRVSMAAFQASFWTRRSDEWEAYIDARSAAGAPNPRPPQGDLTNAPYFDFISHSQWGALDVALDGAADLLAAPQLAAEGWADGPAETEVTADLAAAASTATPSREALPPPPALRTALAEAAGDRIYAMLAEGFQGQAFDPPSPPRPTDKLGTVRAAVQALLDVFVRCGFALSATVALDPDTSPADPVGGLVITVLGPATLWGCAERAARGAAPNALDALAVGGLLRAGQVGATLTGVEVGETGYIQKWVVGEGPVRAPAAGVVPPGAGGGSAGE